MTKEAIVVGGGIAGAAAAVALQRAGFDPVIHERHERAAHELGAYLTVAVNGLNALRAIGLDPDRVLARGFATPELELLGASGRVLAALPLGGPLPDGTVTTTIRRADLYGALRDVVEDCGIPVVYGSALESAERDRDVVVARFAGGSRKETGLLIGADGIRGRTRKILNGDGPEPTYLGLLNTGGFTAGPVAADLAPPPGVMRMAFGRRSFFGWTTAPDGSVWWFANPPRRRPAAPGEFTPDGWRAYLLDLFEGDRSCPAAEIIRASDEIVGPWNTDDLRRVPVWQDGRTVLIGDAAHAVAPSAGQGAAMALEDAAQLGAELRAHGDVGVALAAYERARRGRVERVVAEGRRGSGGKALGPVGSAIRDAMLPMIMRRLHRDGNPQAWILDHRVAA
ncbi:NAD(P)/FAD-dependent oxidoreductase [Actinoplanes sp. NPDC051851]|uniref:FAD-dependent oxidoreductase n=1 Tax=Actinoplanes sp. NPDC051851 TaxID=3154753 RepID=UPI00344526E7